MELDNRLTAKQTPTLTRPSNLGQIAIKGVGYACRSRKDFVKPFYM